MNGLSVKLIESHYEVNYGGALRRLNAITEKLDSLDFENTPGYVINGLKREELVALNSTLLHELYFASLGGASARSPKAMPIRGRRGRLPKRWRATSARSSAGAASSWPWATRSPGARAGPCWSTCRATAGCSTNMQPSIATPWQAAFRSSRSTCTSTPYHIDFGPDVRTYIYAFMRNVDWKAVQARYEDAVKVEPLRPLVQEEFDDLPGVTVEEVKAMLEAGKPVQIIDARPRHSMSREPHVMEGATWRDPDLVQEWSGKLSKSDPVVVFCVYGFHVGCKAATVLRDLGFDAKYMKGGHAAWKAIGGPTKTQA